MKLTDFYKHLERFSQYILRRYHNGSQTYSTEIKKMTCYASIFNLVNGMSCLIFLLSRFSTYLWEIHWKNWVFYLFIYFSEIPVIYILNLLFLTLIKPFTSKLTNEHSDTVRWHVRKRRARNKRKILKREV